MSFFEELTAGTADLHHQTLEHPMVQGIGSGSLPEETFRFYIEQDFQFLLRYVRVLAMAASSTDDLPTMLQLSKLVHSTVDVEIDALRELYRQFGGVPELLDAVQPSPTCVAYTSHLQATALKHNLLVTIAGMLPCQWGYHDIGSTLKSCGLPDDERFAAWIEEYASNDYRALVDWILECFDHLANTSGPAALDHARTAFNLSARYELAFWEMAWTGESWGE